MSHITHTRAPRQLLLATAALLVLSASACTDEKPAAALPEADDRLARAYIHALHDSGAVAVMGRTKRESAAVPAFAFGIEAMRVLMPRGPIDTVQLEKFELLRDTSRTAATRLTYLVQGGGEAAQVDVWVEREGERPVVEELRAERRGSQAARATPLPAVEPARLDAQALSQLRWIVGDWRGTGVDGTTQEPFFERYRFADDSTLLVVSFADSTWRTPTDTSRYELRGGRFGNAGSGAQWVAVRVDADAADFAPVSRARNSFRWARAAGAGAHPSEWRATISAPGTADTEQRRDYRMSRVR